MKSRPSLVSLLFFFLCFAGLTCASGAAIAARHVLVSIKPLELIAAAITQGTSTTTEKLLKPGASPHAYSLHLTDRARIQNADLVFWLGKDMEAFLEPALTSLPPAARATALMEQPKQSGIRIMKFTNSKHVHATEHDPHTRPAPDSATPNVMQQVLRFLNLTKSDHVHPTENDPHIWLAPDNAIAIANVMQQVLSEADADNAAIYRKNHEDFVRKVNAVDAENKHLLEPVKERGFFVFHDAWNYFIHHYQLNVIDSFVKSPENQMGAKHRSELRQALKKAGRTCVFHEPGMPADHLQTLLANLDHVGRDVIDPLAGDIAPGPDAYPQFLRQLATTIHGCLVRQLPEAKETSVPQASRNTSRPQDNR